MVETRNLRKMRLSFDEAAKELRRRFLESVPLHLRSDVKIGAALSGGLIHLPLFAQLST